MVVIQEVFKQVRRHDCVRGTINAFPLVNPIGFETGSRDITLSREDLNRSFPGKPDGSLAERVACRIFDAIERTEPDLVLDLHNDWQKSIPYTVLDPKPDQADSPAYRRAKSAAEHSGFITVLDDEHVKNSFTYSLLNRGVAALTIELGESYIVNEINVAYGVGCILSILQHLGIIDRTGDLRTFAAPPEAKGRLLKYSSETVSTASGIIRFLTRPGDVIKQGQPVARVYNAFGKLQDTIASPCDAIVLSHCDSSVAFPGVPVVAIAVL